MRGVRFSARLAVLVVALWVGGQAFDAQAAAGERGVANDKCRGCHVGDAQSWKENYHSKMVRPARDGLLKDAADNWIQDAKGATGPKTGNVDGRAYGLADVVMVVGSKWKQRYLVKQPGSGGHQFLDKQWNAYTRLWESYGNSEDWETICSACHVKPGGLAAGTTPESSSPRQGEVTVGRQKLQANNTLQK